MIKWSAVFYQLLAASCFLCIFFSASYLDAASISGRVSGKDSMPFLTGEQVRIRVLSGIPCCTAIEVDSVSADITNGSYIISSLPAGTYYVQAATLANSAYTSGWWASPLSKRYCRDAVPITLTAAQELDDINFHLDGRGGPISLAGTVYQAGGATAIPYSNKNKVIVYTGNPCESPEPATLWGGEIAADGSYMLSGLEEGNYYLKTTVTNDDEYDYTDAWWTNTGESTRNCANAELLVLKEGAVPADIDFQLDLGGVISGTLFQADGTTSVLGEDLLVEVYSGNPCGENRRIKSQMIGVYNSEYSISGLASGEYFVKTLPNNRIYYNRTNYQTEWWASPGSTVECSAAQSVTVADGLTRVGINFQLDKGATISGTLFQADGTTSVSENFFSIVVYDNAPCSQDNIIKEIVTDNTDGNYTIYSLSAGTYYLQANPPYDSDFIQGQRYKDDSLRECNQTQEVTVGAGQDIVGTNFQLQLGAMISGTAYSNDGTVRINDESVLVHLMRGEPCGEHELIDSIKTNSVGSFSFPGLKPGTYFLQAESSGSANYISEWWAASGSTKTCDQAEHFSVVQSGEYSGIDFQLDPGSVICGSLNDSSGTEPIIDEEGTVQVYPAGFCDGSLEYSRASLDIENGTYVVNGLPDGEYNLRASFNKGNYIAEWWDSPTSVRTCSNAGSISIVGPEIYTGRDFYLEPGATVSGKVLERDGLTPAIVNLDGVNGVFAYSGDPCREVSELFAASPVNERGWYKINGLSQGQYYLRVVSSKFGPPADEVLYEDEWWRSSGSTVDCQFAQAILVTGGEDHLDKNFQLGPVKFPWLLFAPLFSSGK